MTKASVGWFAICAATALMVSGCGSMRQGESTSRCTDCATALYRDNGSGGSIYNVVSRGEDAVGRVARRYCTERGLGPPTIGNRYTSPLGSGFSGYDFSCGARGETAVAEAPVAQQPAGSGMEKFGATCTSLGFQKGTPEHGNCIVKLMEMNRTRPVESAGPMPQQLRQQQREEAVKVLRQSLGSLSAQPPASCESPATMTIKLPCGDVVSCTKKGDQISCD